MLIPPKFSVYISLYKDNFPFSICYRDIYPISSSLFGVPMLCLILLLQDSPNERSRGR